VEHLAELRAAAAAAGVAEHVTFVPSFTAPQRAALLAAAAAVLYTPQHEHFGIVPLEAMAAGRAVLACASGGPLESVVHDRTVRCARRRPPCRANVRRTWGFKRDTQPGMMMRRGLIGMDAWSVHAIISGWPAKVAAPVRRGFCASRSGRRSPTRYAGC
jgi:glycosyltransferase involved in cell wall biosynthesis